MIILTTITFFILRFCYPQYDWNGLRRRVFLWWAMNCLFAFTLIYSEWFGLTFLISSFLMIFILL